MAGGGTGVPPPEIWLVPIRGDRPRPNKRTRVDPARKHQHHDFGFIGAILPRMATVEVSCRTPRLLRSWGLSAVRLLAHYAFSSTKFRSVEDRDCVAAEMSEPAGFCRAGDRRRTQVRCVTSAGRASGREPDGRRPGALLDADGQVLARLSLQLHGVVRRPSWRRDLQHTDVIECVLLGVEVGIRPHR